MSRRLPASLLLFLAAASLTAAPSREWTDRQGRKITAELISVDFDSVLLRVGPAYHRIGLKTLSEGDQAAANEWKKGNPRAPKPANLPATDTSDPFALTAIPTTQNTALLSPSPTPTPTPKPTPSPKPTPTPTPKPSPAPQSVPVPVPPEVPPPQPSANAPRTPTPTPPPLQPRPSVPPPAPPPLPASPNWPQTPGFANGQWNRAALAEAEVSSLSLAVWDNSGKIFHYHSAKPTGATQRVIHRAGPADRILHEGGGFVLNPGGGRLLRVRFELATRELAEKALLADAGAYGCLWQTTSASNHLFLAAPSGQTTAVNLKPSQIRDPRRLPDGFAFLEREGLAGWKLALATPQGEPLPAPAASADRLDRSDGPAPLLLLWNEKNASWQLCDPDTRHLTTPTPVSAFLPAGWKTEGPPSFAGSRDRLLLKVAPPAPATPFHLLAKLDPETGRPLKLLALQLPPGAAVSAIAE